jgi:hypothetical protein
LTFLGTDGESFDIIVPIRAILILSFTPNSWKEYALCNSWVSFFEADNKNGVALNAAEVSEARLINDLLELFLFMCW